MPIRYSITCKNADGSEEPVIGEIGDEHVELFTDFIEHAERLRQSDFLRAGGRASLNLNWQAGFALQANALLPERPPYTEFIHEIRPFILDNEPTHFYRVLGVVGKEVTNPCFRAVLKAASTMFAGKRIADTVQVRAGDRDVISDAFVRDWLNAFEYHRARDKRQAIEALHQAVPLESTEAIVLMQLVDKASVILNVARMLEHLIGYGQSSDASSLNGQGHW
jgi:hypothetical protein